MCRTWNSLLLSESYQRRSQSIYYNGSFHLLQYMVSQISGDVHTVESNAEKKIIRAFEAIDIVAEKRMVTLEWVASPINDMYADAVLSAVLQADSIDTPKYIPSSAKVDKIHFKECLIEMLQGWEFESF